jgi:hypothetical protein
MGIGGLVILQGWPTENRHRTNRVRLQNIRHARLGQQSSDGLIGVKPRSTELSYYHLMPVEEHDAEQAFHDDP